MAIKVAPVVPGTPTVEGWMANSPQSRWIFK